MIEVRVLTPASWQIWRELRLAALAGAPDAFGSRLADWQDAGELADPMPDGMRREMVMEKQLRSPASAQPVCVPDSCKQDSQP